MKKTVLIFLVALAASACTTTPSYIQPQIKPEADTSYGGYWDQHFLEEEMSQEDSPHRG